MVLSELKRNTRAVVLKVDCEEAVRERLISLGLYVGAKLTVLRISQLKHTYLIQAGASRIAMSRSIAERIHVWVI